MLKDAGLQHCARIAAQNYLYEHWACWSLGAEHWKGVVLTTRRSQYAWTYRLQAAPCPPTALSSCFCAPTQVQPLLQMPVCTKTQAVEDSRVKLLGKAFKLESACQVEASVNQ